MDEGTRGKVSFDLDAFERRLKRQQVIEVSDVVTLIAVLRDVHAQLVRAKQRALDFEALAQRHDEERNRALERADRYESVLRSLVDAVAGEQWDLGELARARALLRGRGNGR